MILITGITGLTGRFLYEAIAHSDLDQENIRYFVRPTSDTSFMIDEDVKNHLLYGHCDSQEELKRALPGIHLVVHVAGINVSEPVVKACLDAGVKRVIFINTTGMYSRFKAYAQSYQEIEKKQKESGLIYTIIRPTMIYGNKLDVNIHKLIKIMDKTLVFPVIGHGKGLMHPIYAQDLAIAILTTIQREEKTRLKEYIVAGKESLSYSSLLCEIAIALGKQRYFLHIPYVLALIVGKIGDWIPNGLIDYEKVQRLEENKSFEYDKAAHDLSFAPRSFADGVKLEVASLRRENIIK